MQTVSDTYKRLRQDPGVWKEIRVDIGGETYGEDRILQMRTWGGLFMTGTMCVGSAVSKQISLAIREPGNIPRMAEIKPYYRLVKGDEASEWVQKGVYYINTREPADAENALRIEGFDAMRKSEKIWVPDQSLVFPMGQRSAALHIAGLMGVELENPEDIREDYYVDYPANEYTQRNILQFIAGAHGGNFTMTDLGKLRLVKLNALEPEIENYVVIGSLCSSLSTPPQFKPITRVVVMVDDENYYAAGDESGRTMEVTCPYGTQAMADNLLAQMGGYAYQPVAAAEALIDPAAELGDSITVGGVYTVFAEEDLPFDHLMAIDVSAPGEREMEQEYQLQTPSQQLNRKISAAYSLISKTAEEIRLEVSGFDGRISALAVTLDGVTITDEDGQTLIKGSSIQTKSITADKLNITGAITFNDLAADVQNDINDAYTLAVSADASAASAVNTVGAWCYPGTTYIDGRMLMTGTVMATTLLGASVGLIAANQTVVGSLDIAYTTTGIGLGISTNYGGIQIKANGGNIFLQSSGGQYVTLGDGYVSLGGGPLLIPGDSYGTSLPSSGTYSQVFFLLES